MTVIDTAPPPAAKKPSKLDAIRAKATAKPASKSARPETPVVVRPDLAAMLGLWHTAKQQFDAAKSLVQTAQAQITAAGRDARLAACRASGQPQSSVRLVPAEGADGGATVTVTSRYCELEMETPEQEARVNALLAAFGDDAGRYFAEELAVKVKGTAYDDPGYEDFLAEFVDVLQSHFGERFDRWFEITRKLTPSKAFHNDYTMKPEVEQTAAPFIADGTIRGYAPTVKV